jgi:hypothetical protein
MEESKDKQYTLKPRPIWPISVALLLISMLGILNLVRLKVETAEQLQSAKSSKQLILNTLNHE